MISKKGDPLLISPLSKTGRQQDPAFSVCGQTWHFTPPTLAALHLYGLGARQSLKALLINAGTSSGIAAGTHKICYQGVDLQWVVHGAQVLVVDPFCPLTA